MATSYDRHIFKQLEDVMKKYDNLSQEIKDIKKAHKIEISNLKEQHKKEIHDLKEQHKEEVESLNKKINELEEEIDILKGKSNQKNSSNSNTPPSKDEYKKQNHREKSFKKKLTKAIKKSKVISTDLTPTSLKGKYAYVRNYSNDKITILEASHSKKIQEIQRQNILPNFRNYIMHDHETGLYNFGIKSQHLECWIHLGRELKYFNEYIKNSWSKELWEFAWNLNKTRKELQEKNITQFTSEELIEYENKNDEIIENGINQNKNTPSKYLRDKEKAVLNRLKKYKQNYLSYLKDFDLPFDDNLSERDLRATKLKKKFLVVIGHLKD